MAKSPDQDSNAVQALLAERSQYEDWLSRLAASTAPDSVRRRVQSDYETRLGKIMESLREHADAIAADLDRFRSSASDLERREAEALETTSEAELRHAVGEFSDAKWEEISRVQNASLDGIRKELTRVRDEITRLTEVQNSIAAEPEHAAPAPAPSPAPAKAASEKPHAPPPPDDELDFLKSVAVEQSASLSPQNATDAQPTPEESVPSPAPAPAAAAPAESAPRAAATTTATPQAKTLKCGECGTLNRPTEWYCERCGAELAAL
jgi:hypothetical protein